MQYSLTTISIIAFTFILAGMVKGVTGMGLPTVAIGMLGLVMGPAEAVTLLVLPTLITNVWQLFAGPRFIDLLRRFATMMAGLFIGSFYGVRLLIHTEFATILLGVVLAGYGAFGLSSIQFAVSPRWERRLSPVTGLITGVLYGSTGLALTAVPYVNSLRLDKDALIQTLSLTFTVCSLGMAFGLAAQGRFQLSVAGTSLLALVPAFVGIMLGQHLRNRMKPEVFRRWFFVWMLILGTYMVVHMF
jgi:uncharacterized protein